jgi:hypothetical protein
MAVSSKQTEDLGKKYVFTTENVTNITKQMSDGVIPKNYQIPWFQKEVGVRKHGLTFQFTQEELEEYLKCSQDIHYFAEKYCKIKREDGSIGEIKLRGYQKEVLDLYKNPRVILCASRQIGKTVSAAITILHFITFNVDKNVMVVANLRATTIEIVDKIKSIYVNLPFFLKTGVRNWNQTGVVCENGCKIKTAARSKTPAIGFAIDFLYLDEFAHIPSNIIEPYYTAVYPTVAAIQNSKIIITSTPNGMNLFHKLLIESQLPEGDPRKSTYKSMMVYWYAVDDRFVTYFRLLKDKLFQNGIEKEEILEQVQAAFPMGKAKMSFNLNLDKDVIYVYNEYHSDEDIKRFIFKKNDREYFIQDLAYVTTWKEETIKEIGGEDAFNQEFGLQFINGSKSLLNESVFKRLKDGMKNYVKITSSEFDRRIKFSYDDLKFVDDNNIFIPLDRNKIKGVMSIDIASGIDRDYSIINIFKISPKPMEIIEAHKKEYVFLSDFFCLHQIGMYRSNLVSVEQLAQLFYVLNFEYFNPDNFKTVVEVNEYGREFLAYLPALFDGNNEYDESIFFRFKHRADSMEERVGVKVQANKDILVKSYQDNMDKGNFIITNPTNIDEMTCFVKQLTPYGNLKYGADSGNDDTVMSIVNASGVFGKYSFREMVESSAHELVDPGTLAYFNDVLKNREYIDNVADYAAILAASRQRNIVKAMQNRQNNTTYKGWNDNLGNLGNLGSFGNWM